MKIFKSWAFVLCAMLLCSTTVLAGGEEKSTGDEQTIYIFGVSSSFSDTLVHITEIQEIKGVNLVNRNGFLISRSLYSYQLETYLENSLNLPNRTCTVCFSKKRSKLEKQYAKVKNRYAAMKNVAVRPLDATIFQFEKNEGGE